MAIRSKSICRHAGCNVLLNEAGYCEQHAKLHQQQSDAQRGSAHQRGYNRRWQKARVTFLMRSPLCKHCADAGLVVAATDVDHIIPHKGDQALFWDSSNWQSLCKSCHSKKTAREDGGFGRQG
jgi:5-methylcytosine-specific restriction protein A